MPVDPVDLVLSIATFVILGVKGEGSSVKGLILLWVLSISQSVGLCVSRDME